MKDDFKNAVYGGIDYDGDGDVDIIDEELSDDTADNFLDESDNTDGEDNQE